MKTSYYLNIKMKILLILLSLLLIAFVIIQVFAIKGQQNIETYTYKVNKKYDTFEIRSYEALFLIIPVRIRNSISCGVTSSVI